MKVFETGKLPVHIALTELYNEATPDEIEHFKIQEEIEHCYSVYTPTQNVFDNVVVKSQIQEEIDMSWEFYYAREHDESVRLKADEVAELAWYDNQYMQNSSNTATDTCTNSSNDYASIKLRNSYACADRRRKTLRSQKRFRASVITAFTNSKRFEDDSHSKVIRNRRRISKPKKQNFKFTKLVKLAEKMKLVPIGQFRRKDN